MPTKQESILEALKGQLDTISGPTVIRNSAVPERIPGGGLIIIRDGDPGEPTQPIGSSVCFYQHTVEIEVFTQQGANAARETAFDTLMAAIGSKLEADKTLGGLIAGMIYGSPSADVEPVEGGADIKAGVISLTMDYTTNSPLA